MGQINYFSWSFRQISLLKMTFYIFFPSFLLTMSKSVRKYGLALLPFGILTRVELDRSLNWYRYLSTTTKFIHFLEVKNAYQQST